MSHIKLSNYTATIIVSRSVHPVGNPAQKARAVSFFFEKASIGTRQEAYAGQTSCRELAKLYLPRAKNFTVVAWAAFSFPTNRYLARSHALVPCGVFVCMYLTSALRRMHSLSDARVACARANARAPARVCVRAATIRAASRRGALYHRLLCAARYCDTSPPVPSAIEPFARSLARLNCADCKLDDGRRRLSRSARTASCSLNRNQ